MEQSNTKALIGIAIVVVVVAVLAAFSVYGGANHQTAASTTSTIQPNSSNPMANHKIQIVAAENFWGSLMQQIGGNRVNVTSIVTDPNADPHEYEASPVAAEEIANAKLVIVNGVGYDDWALKLLSAGTNPNRAVLNVGQLVGVENGSNPHLWYNPAFVNKTVNQMYLDLVQIDPVNASYYKQQYAALTANLTQVDSRIGTIKMQFGGTKVAATEDIFVYLANASGLDLVSPPEFMQAVAEGTDPSVQSVTQFENQLESGNVSVLVYNQQTVDPLTQQIKQIAVENNVTVIGVTETIQPPDTSFEVWMNSELLNLQNALNAKALGQ